MEQLLYDPALESIALQHALQCNFTMNPSLRSDATNLESNLSFTLSDRYPFGENIVYDLSGPTLTVDKLETIIEEQWLIGHQYYDYNASACISDLDSNAKNVDVETQSLQCRSYEKLSWGTTRYIGCGVSICPSLSLPDGDTISPAAFIVCDYWPSFDTDSLPIYKSISSVHSNTNTNSNSDVDVAENVCSECASDRVSECDNGLCAGCPSPKYHFCQNRLDDAICDNLKTDCDTDVVVHLSCTKTCQCNTSDLLPDSECTINELYISPPTTSPTIPMDVDIDIDSFCIYKGWYDVPMIEGGGAGEEGVDITCPEGYAFPNMTAIPYIETHCLMDGDAEMLNHRIPGVGIQPYGIAIEEVQYGMGCDWNRNYRKGVIPTHSGIKCGDGEQLFICVSDTIYAELDHIDDSPIMTSPPSNAPTAGPTFSPSDAPTDGPTAGPSSAPTSGPTAGPSHSPITKPMNTHYPTTKEPEIDITPSTTTKIEPFKMWLIFPDFTYSVDSKNPINGQSNGQRELLSMEVDIEVESTELLNVQQGMNAINGMIDLYPSRGRSLSLPITRGHSHGYRFNVSSSNRNTKTKTNVDAVTLSRIEYMMEATNCNQTRELMDNVTFRLLTKDGDEMNVEYATIGTKEKVVIELMDVSLYFEEEYIFVIDLSVLMDHCTELKHPVHAKTYMMENMDHGSVALRGLQSVVVNESDAFTVHRSKYWTKMSMWFE